MFSQASSRHNSLTNSGTKKSIKRHFIFALTPVLCALTACQTYEDLPFEGEEICQRIVAYREDIHQQLKSQQEKMTYDILLVWMEKNHPEMKKLKADYDVFMAIHGIKPPFPNPSVEFGPTFFMNSFDAPWKVAPFVSLGVTIPLSCRMGCEDYLNELLVQQAAQAYELGRREMQFNLRESYIKALIAQTRYEAQAHRVELSKRLSALGHQKTTENVDLDLYKNEFNESIVALSQSTGCGASVLEKAHLMPVRRIEFLNFEHEYDSHIYLHAQADLLQLEQQFHIEDAKYRLELARQLPDLNIGTAYAADEAAVQTVGVAVGWEIPVFDRNQRAIAESKAQRDAALIHYEVALMNFLNEHEEGNKEMLEIAEKYHSILELNSAICSDCGYLLCRCDSRLYVEKNPQRLQDEVKRMNHYLDYLNHESAFWVALLAKEKRTGIIVYPISSLETRRPQNIKRVDTQSRVSPFYRFFNLY